MSGNVPPAGESTFQVGLEELPLGPAKPVEELPLPLIGWAKARAGVDALVSTGAMGLVRTTKGAQFLVSPDRRKSEGIGHNKPP